MKRALLVLTMVIGVQTGTPQTMPSRSMKTQPMPELPRMLAYRLTANKLEQYTQASKNVTAALQADPALKQRMKVGPKDAPRTLDESAVYAKEHFPQCYAAVEKSGMSYRDYTLFEGSLLLAWVANTRPHPGSKVQILPENLKFVQDHREKIAALLQSKKAG